MCGRYASFLPAEALASIFGVTGPLPNFPPSWNVAPTTQRPVIRRHPDGGDRRLDLLAWCMVGPIARRSPWHFVDIATVACGSNAEREAKDAPRTTSF